MDPFFKVSHDALISRRDALQRRGAPLSEDGHRELTDIESALSRISKGSYGHCELCGRAIGRQRLRAIPEARCCSDCG
jgi:RNA polymerase-binding transcription factor DksA